MQADPRFLNLSRDFWAHVRTLSEALGYTTKQPGHIAIPQYLVDASAASRRNSTIKVPTVQEMAAALSELGLRSQQLRNPDETPSELGDLLHAYFAHRADMLNNRVEAQLMNADHAEELYRETRLRFPNVEFPEPMNKQKGTKRAPAYLTCLTNLLIAAHSAGHACNFDPQHLTKFTRDRVPFRTLARRIDGTFPTTNDPVAVWEIKEYYYTTTFGSRIADGVYETLLDGMELKEARESGCRVQHMLIIDSHYTWWGCGKSYLCRLVDMLHMGLVDHILVGREVVDQLPHIVQSWVEEANELGGA